MTSQYIALTTAAAMADPAPSGGATPAKGRPRMHKAQLTIYDPPAKGSAGGRRGALPFQFNPKEVTISKSAKWERKPAKGASKAGPPEFTGSEPAKLTLEMFFDATAAQDGSVVKAVEVLMACCVPTPESIAAKKPSPPLVVLHWGSTASFPAFITSVSVKLTLFNADGTPIRATCAVQLEEMPGDEYRKQNPTSGSYDVRRVHRTVAGDSLASVAFAEYGDPASWRALARFNAIDDPLRVPAGTLLLLPSPEELAASGGPGGEGAR